MKRKIKPMQIICFILLEIVLIEAFLVFFYFKKVNGGAIATAKTESLSNGKQSLPLIVPKLTETTENMTDATKKSIINLLNIKNKNDQFYTDILGKFSFRLRPAKDEKIPDNDPIQKIFIATTYDLSYESCGKYPDHPAYGITYTGKKAIKGRTIAVDPSIIPLGSNVYIEFPKPYSNLTGWYTAEDTGSKVKGNIIDVFLGESAFHEMERFGSRKVEVKIMTPDITGENTSNSSFGN